jgi:O-antigen/teichoic acid export membrane protein
MGRIATGMEQSGETGQSARGGLLRGAAILGLAAVVSKLLGTLQKIPLQNIAGDQVFGIYNAVYPLYIFILTLATAGFPIAVSKFVADCSSQGDLEEAGRVFRIAAGLLALTGLLGFAALYTGADGIAAAIGMRDAAPGIRSVSFALLAAPVMAAVRGYFQGLGDMVPTAVTQVIEQLVRVAVMIGLMLWLIARHAGPAAIAAGATFGSTAGAAGGLAAVLFFWRRRGRLARRRSPEAAGRNGEDSRGSRESAVQFIRRFAAFAIPVCLGSVALPVLTLVDAFTVPRRLAAGGLTEAAAAHWFGIYNHGLPLVQLVTMIATSMAAALVPAVAQAAAANDPRLLQTRTEPVLRFTWLVGLAAAFGLAVTALPVNVMLFAAPDGWRAMSIVAFTALFATLHVVSGCMLQGLGAVVVPARSLFAAAILKAAGNLLLVPVWGIEGAAVSAVIAYAAAAALNLRALRALAPQALPPRRFLLRPVAAALCMSLAVLAVEGSLLHLLNSTELMPLRLRHTAAALAAVAAGAAVYAAALLRTGAVQPAELSAIPGFATRWQPVLLKLRLLPKPQRLNQ